MKAVLGTEGGYSRVIWLVDRRGDYLSIRAFGLRLRVAVGPMFPRPVFSIGRV